MFEEETDVLDTGAAIIVDDAAPVPLYEETAKKLGWVPIGVPALSWEQVLQEARLLDLTPVNDSCSVVVNTEATTEEAADGSSRSVNECSNEQEVQQVRD